MAPSPFRSPGILERRQHSRISLDTPIMFRSQENVHSGYARNISEGGIFVATDARFEVGADVLIEFSIPRLPRSFCLQGKVAYVRACDTPRPNWAKVGMGLQFVNFEGQYRASIKDVVLQGRIIEGIRRPLSREDVNARYKCYVNPSIARVLGLMGCGVESRAKHTLVEDSEGNQYIDASGGFGVFSLGHGHPKVVMRAQAQLLAMPLSSKLLYNEPLARLSELLAFLSPGDLRYSFICNSGTEAVEGALKLARAASGKPKIISAFNSFHGKTFGSLSATGKEVYREPFYPLLPDFVLVPFGDPEAVEEAIDDRTAAVILEPIQGEGGVIIPPPNYLKDVRELCDRKGVLFIADEVQTGLGRTGRMFAVDHDGVVPDIMTLGKALGGGVMPIGAFIGNERVWQPLIKHPFIHTSTFGGNPLACAAAVGAIEAIVEEDLPRKAEEKGRYLLQELHRLKGRYPELIRDVRGLGLLIGVELKSPALSGRIISEALKARVLLAFALNDTKVIRIEPPLTIGYGELGRILEALDYALGKARPYA